MRSLLRRRGLGRAAASAVAAQGERVVGASESAPTTVLRVDWPACAGRGLCAELLPERITLDEWGFPIVTPDVPDSLRSLANEAVAACPHSALRIVHR